MRANLGAAIVGASLMLPTAAQAQSVWGGPASTTTTQNYKLGTNWDPNGAPIAAGQSAIFDATGKSTVNVGPGAIAPDSWTFNANSQSYTITGAAVNFSATGGIFNNANAGQTISIDNNLGGAGAQLQQSGNSTLILSGGNSYSGGTLVSNGGTLRANLSSSVGAGTVTLDNGQFQAGG